MQIDLMYIFTGKLHRKREGDERFKISYWYDQMIQEMKENTMDNSDEAAGSSSI